MTESPDPPAVPPRATDPLAVPVPEASGRQEAREAVQRTRTSGLFKSLVAGAVVLVLLLVFILENTRSVPISYFGATGRMPLGVALLLAAVAGALLVGIVGTARIVQLRRRVRHEIRR